MENNLNNVIESPRIRKWIYIVYSLAAFVLGAIAAGVNAVNGSLPEWHTIAVAVTGFVGVGIGAIAAANTPKKEEEPATPETIAARIENS